MKKSTAFSILAGAALAAAFASVPEPKSGTFTGRVSFAGEPPSDAGKVVFEGEKPELKPLTIDAEKSKGCAKEGESMDTTDQSLLIGANGGIANVVVTVEVDGATVKAPEAPVHLDQKTCRFEPHVTVVPVGTKLELLNSDSISHNVHLFPGKNAGFNQTISAGAKQSYSVDKEDRIEVKCDIHPWMNAWLIVANTPYYAVTGPDGSFAIEGLPAGEHKVEYWHEKLGKQKGTIKVAEGGAIEPVEVKMTLEKKGGRKR
jgi:plastocyanin